MTKFLWMGKKQYSVIWESTGERCKLDGFVLSVSVSLFSGEGLACSYRWEVERDSNFEQLTEREMLSGYKPTREAAKQAALDGYKLLRHR